MILDKDDPPLQGGVIKKIYAYVKKSFKKLLGFFYEFPKLLFKLLLDNKKFAFKLVFLLVLVMIPWISEASVNDQFYADLKKYSEPIDPVRAGEFVEEVSKYTPQIQTSKEDVALAMMSKDDSYTLDQQLSINANKNIEEPVRQESTYTVKQGETVTQIAERFGLHVATLLEKNNISATDLKKIQPGTVLNIPSSDVSSSTDWLVAIKDAEAAEKAAKDAAEKKRLDALNKSKLAAAAKKSKVLAATTSRYTSDSGYDGVDNSDLGTPISSRGISQYFGRGHTGVDYMADIGTPVYAAASGRVVVTSGGWSGGYGNQIVIDHGGSRDTRYAHLSSINVSAGENVSRGQVIGYSGNTGRSTGPHLHFELIIGGRPVNPF